MSTMRWRSAAVVAAIPAVTAILALVAPAGAAPTGSALGVASASASGVTAAARAAATPRLSVGVRDANGTRTVRVMATASRVSACALTTASRTRSIRLPALRTSAGSVAGWSWQIGPTSPSGVYRVAVVCSASGARTLTASRLFAVPGRVKLGPLVTPGSVTILAGSLLGKASAQAPLLPPGALEPGSGYGGPSGNIFPWGWCTWGAWEQAQWLGRAVTGNARVWKDQAARAGFRVGQVPQAGAVFVSTAGYYGHVGYVTGVISPSRFATREMNGGSLLPSPPYEYGKTTEFGRFVNHVKATGPNMWFIYPPTVAPPSPAPPAPPASPPPAPAPPPVPGPVIAQITVNTCNTYNNCDYWNPIWVHSNPAVSSRVGDVYRGTVLTARCWASGRVLTDGSNSTSEDDARQFTSGLWFGVDWSGGRGFVPAVWTTKSENHLGLPGC